MRKIEQQMNTAVYNKDTFQLNNTLVSYSEAVNISTIYLHGHIIAVYIHDTQAMMPSIAVFKDWPTKTTASRLRALGIKASLKQGEAAIDGVVL